jgi:MinD-like ATPase involved in chromosome partitioning or flagellar assembly
MQKEHSNSSISKKNCETISIVSGKGGTGKTFLVACLAYALQKADQRVCLIDTDFSTQGLSLFILGPGAERGVSKIENANSLYHMVMDWQDEKSPLPIPKQVDRISNEDHDANYQIIISNIQFYDRRLSLGIEEETAEAKKLLGESMGEETDAFRSKYRGLIKSLIRQLTESNEFDYILIDTRGGFGELSLIPAIFSDSFLVVSEPDFTSFHQLAKLLTNIDLMAQQEDVQPFIRGVIVNKATSNEEERFRALLESQFDIDFGFSWPIPLDPEAIKAYKQQLIPFRIANNSLFSLKVLKAFTDIFDIVTVEWKRSSKEKWHTLVNKIESNYNEVEKEKKERDDFLTQENQKKQDEIQSLQQENNKAKEKIKNQLNRLEENLRKLQAAEDKLASLQIKLNEFILGFELEKERHKNTQKRNTQYENQIEDLSLRLNQGNEERKETERKYIERKSTFRTLCGVLIVASVVIVGSFVGLFSKNREIKDFNSAMNLGENKIDSLFLVIEDKNKNIIALQKEIDEFRYNKSQIENSLDIFNLKIIEDYKNRLSVAQRAISVLDSISTVREMSMEYLFNQLGESKRKIKKQQAEIWALKCSFVDINQIKKLFQSFEIEKQIEGARLLFYLENEKQIDDELFFTLENVLGSDSKNQKKDLSVLYFELLSAFGKLRGERMLPLLKTTEERFDDIDFIDLWKKIDK